MRHGSDIVTEQAEDGKSSRRRNEATLARPVFVTHFVQCRLLPVSPEAKPSREIRLSRSDQVARRATRGALRSKVARGRAGAMRGESRGRKALSRLVRRDELAV